MKKILFISLMVILAGLTLGGRARAYEGECHLKHCLVPAPTILGPLTGETVNTQRPGIKGLTWKTTVVKVFIDGIEVPEVKQIKHQDYYGSFYAEPNYNLAPGIHYAYTIAYSEKPGWYDQSKESTYIYFTVELPVQLTLEPEAAMEPAEQLEAEAELEEVPSESIIDSGGQSANINSDIISSGETPASPNVGIVSQPENNSSVQVETGKIEGGVSVEEGSLEDQAAVNRQTGSDTSDIDKKTRKDGLALQGAAGLSDLGEILQDEFINKEIEAKAKQNRIIGLSLLALIIIFSVTWLAMDKRKLANKENAISQDILPPPPEPPTEKKPKAKYNLNADKIQQSKEVVPPPIESINQPEKKQSDYFAMPPYSPHSPYPPIPEEPSYEMLPDEDRLFNREVLNDLNNKGISINNNEQKK